MELEEARESTKGINNGLQGFMLKLIIAKGENLIDHMIKYRNIRANDNNYEPNTYLGIGMKRSKHAILKPFMKEFTQKASLNTQVKMMQD